MVQKLRIRAWHVAELVLLRAWWLQYPACLGTIRIGKLVLGRTANLDLLRRACRIRVGGFDYRAQGRLFAVLPDSSIVRDVTQWIGKFWSRKLFSRVKSLSGMAGGVSEPSAILPKAARGKKRSVLLLHNCYYNFYYLAEALRKRGWDALSVGVQDPNGPSAQFYHGEDVNIFDADPGRYERNLFQLFDETKERFRMVHFYGVGAMSIFPHYFDKTRSFDDVPVDFLELRRRGIKIGYTVAGCLDGVAQSSIARWSGACEKCVWQAQPDVCSDVGNLAWGRKVHLMCDLVDTSGSPALDWKGNHRNVYRESLTMALDPQRWRPDLEIPEKYRLQRKPGELIVYHAVGNYDLRTRKGRNVKGTGAILAAIERLQNEGFSVRLEFVSGIPSRDVRFIQSQADVMVDQLNYGRYGAQAAEGLMLGKPTVCYINYDEPAGVEPPRFVSEAPIVSASEITIYDVLKDLLNDPARRNRLAAASRAFALEWHTADACAARFESMYDRLMQGLSPEEPRQLSAHAAKLASSVANVA